jgi:hypothetical protein
MHRLDRGDARSCPYRARGLPDIAYTDESALDQDPQFGSVQTDARGVESSRSRFEPQQYLATTQSHSLTSSHGLPHSVTLFRDLLRLVKLVDLIRYRDAIRNFLVVLAFAATFHMQWLVLRPTKWE